MVLNYYLFFGKTNLEKCYVLRYKSLKPFLITTEREEQKNENN